MPRTTLLRNLAVAALIGVLVLVGQASFGQASSGRAVKVAWGDTLWGLSRRYGVSMQQLAATNHMRVTDVLYAGKTLYLPSSGSSSAPAPTPPTPLANQQTFCSSYQPPTGPKGELPTTLTSDPARLSLRPTFAKWARKYRVPLSLMEAEAWQESGWQNNVVSPAGAVGIGQLLPSTAVFVNQRLGTSLQLTVPSDNIEMMAAFLSYLLKSTRGQVCSAVASYYQGLTTTRDVGVIPESQLYVRNVLSLRPRFE